MMDVSSVLWWMMRDRLRWLKAAVMFSDTRVNKSGRSLPFSLFSDVAGEGKFGAGRVVARGTKQRSVDGFQALFLVTVALCGGR